MARNKKKKNIKHHNTLQKILKIYNFFLFSGICEILLSLMI